MKNLVSTFSFVHICSVSCYVLILVAFSRLREVEDFDTWQLQDFDQGVWWHLVLIIGLLALSSGIIFLLHHMAKRHRRKRTETRQEEVRLNDPAHVEQAKPSRLPCVYTI